MAERNPSWTGMTDQEAEEFHKYYLQGLYLFVGIAIVAHILVWYWRPWIPGPAGYKTSAIDAVHTVASAVLPYFS